MMVPFSTVMPIQKMNMPGPVLQVLKDLLWLLAGMVQTQTRLKLMTSQQIHGLKLPIIHIIHSKFYKYSPIEMLL